MGRTNLYIIDEDLWKYAKKEAKRRKNTISEYIFYVIETYMKNEKEKEKELDFWKVMEYLGFKGLKK